MSRPELLFPLFSELETLSGIGPRAARNFAALGVERPKDLLFLLPHSGVDRSIKASLRDVVLPATVTVEVEVGSHFPPAARGRPYRVMVRDARLEFMLVFFHAKGDYLQSLLPTGQRRIVSGKVELFDGVAQMAHPDHVLRPDEAASLPSFEPVYPLTAGITQKLVAKGVAAALERCADFPEWIDPTLIDRQGWPDWRSAVQTVHAPKGPPDIAHTAPARQRLAYDELFAHQLTLSLARAVLRRGKGVSSVGTGALQKQVVDDLPYPLTNAQIRAVRDIAADMACRPDRRSRPRRPHGCRPYRARPPASGL